MPINMEGGVGRRGVEVPHIIPARRAEFALYL